MSKEIINIGKNTKGFVTEVGLYTFNAGYHSATNNRFSLDVGGKSWEQLPRSVQGYQIVPFGANNDLPQAIRDVMEANNLAPGILNREEGLLYGDGPQLYRVVFENGEIRREYADDKEIWAWLKSWNHRRYIEMAMVEYKYMGGIFSRQYLNRGARIGMPAKITKLEIEPNVNSRLAWVDTQRLEDVPSILVGDFEHNCFRTGVVDYPIFDTNNPFKYPVSMSYHNSYSFARNFYALPSYYGSLRWITRSSDIPEIIKYLTENSLTAAFHVHSPQRYWDDREDQLRVMHPGETEDKLARRLDDLKTQTFEGIANILSGKKNTGKFIETVDYTDDRGNTHAWKIEPVDQKISDFIDAQLKISEMATSATTSGMGLHASLSNIVVGGKLASGSEMLYALKLYLATDTTIPEEIIFENLNQAIAANFPEKDLKIGFYHSIVKTEDQTAPADRVKNNV